LSLIILGIILYYVSDFLCRVEVKCKNCPKTSRNIIESKKTGFYIGNYESKTKVIELKNYQEKITLENIWAESTWIKNTDNCLCPKFEKINGYNVIIQFKNPNKDDFNFSLKPITEDKKGEYSLGIGLDRKEMRFENLPEILKIVVEERNPKKSVGWQKGIITDTITFKLRKTSYNSSL
jgi:hypothetical protein